MSEESPLTRRPVGIPLVGRHIETSDRQPDGSYVIRITAVLPPGVLKEPRTLLALDGRPPNVLDGAIAGPVSILLNVWEDRVEPTLLPPEEPVEQSDEAEQPEGEVERSQGEAGQSEGAERPDAPDSRSRGFDWLSNLLGPPLIDDKPSGQG